MLSAITTKIQDWETVKKTRQSWQNQTVVFTNGCFDILHYGHLHYLAAAKALGDKLIIGLNAATSIQRLKGKHRPINDDLTRTYLLAGLQCVDAVVIFEQNTPRELLHWLQPDILVKGGDYEPQQIVGWEIVLAYGGKVKSLPFVEGYSTTNIEQKIRNNWKQSKD